MGPGEYAWLHGVLSENLRSANFIPHLGVVYSMCNVTVKRIICFLHAVLQNSG